MLATPNRLKRWVRRFLAPVSVLSTPVPIRTLPPPPVANRFAPPVSPVRTDPRPPVKPADSDSETPLYARAESWEGEQGLRWLPPIEHAKRLLIWLQEPRAQTLTFAEVHNAYFEFCMEEWIAPIGWVAVARHFTGMTGGKAYRSAVDPRSGLREARERIYRIPARRKEADKPVAPGTSEPMRRAA
ncbi:hypothetical protein [Filomicrobium sp.]|uniref:hypothetical protein n=1 Tax=Filomicrobium sp. TaxID=2024831 RepID=UPI00258CB637|nr:hypothetical protein [Filomicrobium sp.]MCV0371111.1 hypothetical protein [Filomicrobium sp.]